MTRTFDELIAHAYSVRAAIIQDGGDEARVERTKMLITKTESKVIEARVMTYSDAELEMEKASLCGLQLVVLR